MPSTGNSRAVLPIGRIGIVVLLAALAGGLWWWQRTRGAAPVASQQQPPPSPTASHGATGAGPAASAPTGPASVAVTVSGERGPIAGAVVRLSPRTGEVVTATTGADGVARAEQLAPGSWRISASAADYLPGALPTTELAADARVTLALRLSSGGRTLRGTVSDATGGPIAGARVDASRLTATLDPDAAVASTLTAADGGYRLQVPEGSVLVAAASADYAPQARTVVVGPAGAVADFALVPGGVIEGVVRDAVSRQPVAGAAVTAQRDSAGILLAEPSTRAVTTGADGRFRVSGLRPGAWTLAARQAARFAKTPTVVGLGVAEQVTDIELWIGAGPAIRGRVVDDAGAPAPGAAVVAMAAGQLQERTADDAGAFSLEGIPPARYQLTAHGARYLPGPPTAVTLADRDVDGVVVVARRGITLKGHVEPRQACEIEEARDAAPSFSMMSLPRRTTASSDGEFTLGPLAGGAVTIRARCASGDRGSARTDAAPGGADVVVPVAPGGSIAGRVVDDRGQPVAGVVVMASLDAQGESTVIVNGQISGSATALTDGGGAYRVTGLAPGPHRLAVLEQSRPMVQRRGPPTVALAAGERKAGVDLEVDRPDGVISGVVLGPDGAPLADAWVTAEQDLESLVGSLHGKPERSGATVRSVLVTASSADDGDGGGGGGGGIAPALTDAQGRFAIRGLMHASYNVIAEAERGRLRARAAGVKPDATIRLAMRGLSALSGKVVGAAGPTAQFSITLDGPTHETRSFTGGSYAFGRVEPGTYTVRVRSADGNADVTVEVGPDQPATADIALVANAIVTGKLVDATGKPLAGKPVALIPDRGDGRVEIRFDGPPPTSGPDGAFRIEHKAGPCQLMVLVPPSPFFKKGLVLEAGKTLDLGAITVATAPPGGGSGGPPGGSAAPRP